MEEMMDDTLEGLDDDPELEEEAEEEVDRVLFEITDGKLGVAGAGKQLSVSFRDRGILLLLLTHCGHFRTSQTPRRRLQTIGRWRACSSSSTVFLVARCSLVSYSIFCSCNLIGQCLHLIPSRRVRKTHVETFALSRTLTSTNTARPRECYEQEQSLVSPGAHAYLRYLAAVPALEVPPAAQGHVFHSQSLVAKRAYASATPTAAYEGKKNASVRTASGAGAGLLKSRHRESTR